MNTRRAGKSKLVFDKVSKTIVCQPMADAGVRQLDRYRKALETINTLANIVQEPRPRSVLIKLPDLLKQIKQLAKDALTEPEEADEIHGSDYYAKKMRDDQ